MYYERYLEKPNLILTISFSVQSSGIKYIHIAGQPSPPSISRTFSSPWTEIPSPWNTDSPAPFLLFQTLFVFVRSPQKRKSKFQPVKASPVEHSPISVRLPRSTEGKPGLVSLSSHPPEMHTSLCCAHTPLLPSLISLDLLDSRCVSDGLGAGKALISLRKPWRSVSPGVTLSGAGAQRGFSVLCGEC